MSYKAASRIKKVIILLVIWAFCLSLTILDAEARQIAWLSAFLAGALAWIVVGRFEPRLDRYRSFNWLGWCPVDLATFDRWRDWHGHTFCMHGPERTTAHGSYSIICRARCGCEAMIYRRDEDLPASFALKPHEVCKYDGNHGIRPFTRLHPTGWKWRPGVDAHNAKTFAVWYNFYKQQESNGLVGK